MFQLSSRFHAEECSLYLCGKLCSLDYFQICKFVPWFGVIIVLLTRRWGQRTKQHKLRDRKRERDVLCPVSICLLFASPIHTLIMGRMLSNFFFVFFISKWAASWISFVWQSFNFFLQVFWSMFHDFHRFVNCHFRPFSLGLWGVTKLMIWSLALSLTYVHCLYLAFLLFQDFPVALNFYCYKYWWPSTEIEKMDLIYSWVY